MKAASIIVVICMMTLCGWGTALAESEEFQKAYTVYAYGDYNEAAKQFHALLYPLRLKDEKEILRAHQYLGICYYILTQRLAAENEFRAILRIYPQYSLDPLFTPPDILGFFETVRLEARGEVQRKKALFFLSFIPFGVGQFQNGQKVKGYVLLGTEGAALVTNLVTFYARKTMETSPNHYWKRDVVLANRLQDAQLVAFWVFVGAALYGIVDAVWNFSPKEIESGGRPEGLGSGG